MSDKNKVEAVLFSAGKKVELSEIARLCRLSQERTLELLKEIQQDYNSRDSSLKVFDEGTAWKITVKEDYLPIVQNIVAETELEKSLMQTLAVIAWKYPVTQAEVIKIRHNKAYDHMKQLEEMGFVAKEKYGRTFRLRLTPKFFNYFDLPDKKHAKEAFKDVLPAETIKNIEGAEREIEETEQLREEMIKKKEEIEAEIRKNREEEAKKEATLGEELEEIEEKLEFKETLEQEKEIVEEERSPKETEEFVKKEEKKIKKLKKEEHELKQVIKEEIANVEEKEEKEIKKIKEDIKDLEEKKERKFYD
ncbi:MAG: SMC-Scp complex subunit ScpB [Candidatus Woesearchaeota archaeon]